MSGYDYDNKCGNDWDYNDCHKPRRPRRPKKRHNDCWDSYSYCS